MKEILKLYYNFPVDIDVIENDTSLNFIFNNKMYYLFLYLKNNDELQDLINLNNELIQKNIPTSRFIPNKNNEYLTIHNQKNYVLLEMDDNVNKEYSIIDMVDFANILTVNSKNTILYRNKWGYLWSSKIDYFEYQVSQLGKDKPIILNSFSYYVGMAENAIAYANNTIKNYQISIYEKITLQRRRVSFPNIKLNYFNPLNYVIDIELRDIASYFKSLFFNSYEDLWIEVNAFFKRKKLSIYGYQLLYARLLYPSYYFDIYENIMEKKCTEEELIPIINKVDLYEDFLRDIYQIILKYAPIESIDWITNKKEL
jgi:spore coat protein YutH